MKLGKKASYHVWRSCISKRTFESEEDAITNLATFIAGLGEAAISPDRLHVYACDFRPHFHIGHAALPLRYVEPK